jgi:glutamyl-tRNA reductase
MAAYTGAASTRAQALIDEVADVVRAVREGTSWGHQMREYTHVALDGVLSNQPLAGKRCLVIGGSTTSCSVLRYLVERGVAPDRLTIAYRGEGRRRLVQQVRQIAGEGATRLRLGAYDAPELRTALCNADLVFLGIDRAEPILSPSGLQRDGSHPLTILDFNTHPSTHGLATQPGVTLIEAHAIAQAVEEAARASLRDPMFHQAAIDAERAIAQRVAMGP